MSRSRQAYRLGYELGETLGVRVELVHESGATWHVDWADGPTVEEMREHVASALAGYHFPDLRDRTLRFSRGSSSRSWAARAIAARRDGSLAREVKAGASWRRANPPGYRLPKSDLSEEDFAMHHYVEDLQTATSYPERASDPADEELIEELLAAGKGNEYDMARVLVNELKAPEPADSGPALRVVPDA